MSDQESVGRTLYDLIGGFFRRDLSYILGGGLFVLALDLFAWPPLPEVSLLDYYPLLWSRDLAWMGTLAWVLAAYVLGLMLSELGDGAGLINKQKTLPEKYLGQQIRFYQANEAKREAMKIHERTVGFMHLCSSVGMGMLFGLPAVALWCGYARPECWAGALLAAAGLAWRARSRYPFSTALSWLVDGVLGAGIVLMGARLWASHGRLTAVWLAAAWIFLGLSRVFSRKLKEEREVMDAMEPAPSLDAAPTRRLGKRRG
jgi:hypothetical protein